MRAIFIFIPLFFSALIAHGQDAARTKHALLVCIGNYPSDGNYGTLSSLNDLAHLEKALAVQGFADNLIIRVKDEQATLPGIKKSFEDLSNRVKPGDVVMVHFSCHGRQLEADSENKIDGLDECIVPFDAIGFLNPRKPNFNEVQAKYLRGHVLGDMLSNIRAKLGPKGDLCVFLDFCSSGGATRGSNKVRGVSIPLTNPGFDPAKHKPSDSSLLLRKSIANATDENTLSPFVVISATRPEELDTEASDENGEGIGPLSYSMYKSFINLSPGTTYRSLFAKVQSYITSLVPDQHPILEGNGVDRELFGGDFIPQKPFVEIDSVLTGNRLKLKGGKIAGLGEGATLSIYPSGTIDPDKANALATGKVVMADNLSAYVELDKNLTINQPADAWAFIKAPIFSMKRVAVQIIGAASKSIAKAMMGFSAADSVNLQKTLADLPSVVFTNRPEVWITKENDSVCIRVSANGYLFYKLKNDASLIDSLRIKLTQFAQYTFLVNLTSKERNVDLEVKLIPIIDGKAATENIAKRMVNGILEIPVGESVAISVSNKGTGEAYFNILDLQPDGLINPILPKKDRNGKYIGPGGPDDLKILPGQTIIYPPDVYKVKIGPPNGMEIFKVFATCCQPLDMESIATSKTPAKIESGKRGALQSMEQLLKASYEGSSTRGAGSEGTIFDVVFRIKPKL
jgi:hypothetical protein